MKGEEWNAQRAEEWNGVELVKSSVFRLPCCVVSILHFLKSAPVVFNDLNICVLKLLLLHSTSFCYLSSYPIFCIFFLNMRSFLWF